MGPATVFGAVIAPILDEKFSRLSNVSLGHVLDMGGHLIFVHYREAFAREYRFDEAMLQGFKSRQALPRELATTLHRLRLINSRNRLTHALEQSLLEVQAPFM